MLVLLISATFFALVGLIYALRLGGLSDLEEYVRAPGEIGGWQLAATLFASGMGAWILFSPAEVGATFGVAGLVGYAVGSSLPVLLFALIGRRIREYLPQGRGVSEYAAERFGPSMHRLTTLVTVFYMTVALTAGLTGMALLMQQMGGVALPVTVVVVLGAALAYTAVGGLRASIFTDGVQTLIILPLLAGLLGAALLGVGGQVGGDAIASSPLLSWTNGAGWQQALMLVIAIFAAEVFNQGVWQRVYAARSVRALQRGFAGAAALILPIVLTIGALGLAAALSGYAEPPSTALFQFFEAVLPDWTDGLVIVLAIALVMSSVDTLLNALASIAAQDLGRWRPSWSERRILSIARWVTVALTVPVGFVASQGYSVLYLFLVADLVCAAVAVAIVAGLFTERIGGRAATIASLAGLFFGGILFPSPAFDQHLLGAVVDALGTALPAWLATPDLLTAFLVAALVPGVMLTLEGRRSLRDVPAVEA